MSESRSDELTRRISELLAALVLESDDGLEAFRARYAIDPALDLARIRSTLEAIGHSLVASTPSGRPKMSTLESPMVPPMPVSGVAATPATLPTGHMPWPVVISPSVPPRTPGSLDATAIDPQSITLGEGQAPLSSSIDGPRPPFADLNSTAASVLALDSKPLPLERPVLTIEQYASLQAELQRASPTERALVAARYGINTSEAEASLEEHWHARFAADAALRTRFGELVAHYATWLASQKR